MPSPFAALVAHYEKCLALHGDTPRGVDWPDAESARIRYRVMTELMRADRAPSLLDFGCGAGHFLDYLRQTGRNDVAYRGLDLSERFVDLCRRKYPGVTFDLVDALADCDAVPEVDYIVLNGVFTERQSLSYDEMLEAMKSLLNAVFSRARKGIAFNLMSKYVDWERDDLFHVPYNDIIAFVVERLSRRHVIRADYGLFEYTVYVYKRPSERECAPAADRYEPLEGRQNG